MVQIRLLKLSLSAVFLLSLASMGAIILLVNPYKASALNMVLFSAVIFLVLFSLLAWLGFWAREKFVTERNLNHILKMAFRQGGLVALLLVSYLWLSHFKMLKVWILLPVLFLIIGLEYYFLIYHGNRNNVAGD